MSAKQKIDAITWYKRHFGLGATETFRADRLCPVCGCWSCDVSHAPHEYGRLRPSWTCTRCHHSGVGVFSLVKALAKGLPHLDAGARWLESQGVTVSPEVLETGHGTFPLGAHGRAEMDQQEAARRSAERKAQYQEAAPTTEQRIVQLEAELKALRAKK